MNFYSHSGSLDNAYIRIKTQINSGSLTQYHWQYHGTYGGNQVNTATDTDTFDLIPNASRSIIISSDKITKALFQVYIVAYRWRANICILRYLNRHIPLL